ncbi:MAG: hypothetical protein CMH63_00830 [Nanoarchaeota archaeon]|nr:hypothetical protein [Nanoarchaeota archaeon]|tara:strand:+ start:4687 stop:5388 length:702 start_codon:yes stop_codon:yes gene_type:complete
MSDPKILIGCPTSFHKEYALPEYAKALKALTYSNHDILLVDNSKDDNYKKKIEAHGLPVIKGHWFESARDRIIASRNILRQKTLEKGYDYFFSLEQDVLPPPNILQDLLKHNKQLITAIYFADNVIPGQTLPQLIPLVYVLEDPKTLSMRPLNNIELWDKQGLMEVVSAGLGCVLIHKDILKQVKFRYEKNTFDDRWFFIDIYHKKIPVFADTSLKCKHLIHNRPYPWSSIQK